MCSTQADRSENSAYPGAEPGAEMLDGTKMFQKIDEDFSA